MDILFQNEHFIIVDKPALTLTTPGREGPKDERRCIGTELQSKLNLQIYPVHRLDFEVSGAVLFAKSSAAHVAANAWFEKKQVSKTYQAVTQAQSFDHVPANVQNSRAGIDLTLGQDFVWRTRMLRGKRRAYEHREGKPSETRARFVEAVAAHELRWELNPVTGRAHQLRFDLSRHGFPILGDALYGAKLPFAEAGIALRSVTIDFSRAADAPSFGLPSLLRAPSWF